MVFLAVLAGFSSLEAGAQVRGKLPDRGVYQPPRLAADGAVESQSLVPPQAQRKVDEQYVVEDPAASGLFAEMLRLGVSGGETGKKPRPLVDVVVETSGVQEPTSNLVPHGASQIAAQSSEAALHRSVERQRPMDPHRVGSGLQQVTHEEVVLTPPQPPSDTATFSPTVVGRPAAYSNHAVVLPIVEHDATCDGCDQCYGVGCDSIGCGVFGCDSCGDYCDTLGCDSMGCDGRCVPWYRRWRNGLMSFRRDRWFGGIEYLMMWQRGDRIPALVTSTTDATPDPDTAGELGLNGTVILVGQDRIMERLGSGGRITIGTWLDDRQCVSLVGRGWYGGRKSYHYNQSLDQVDETGVLVRPFLNVSDGQTPEQDTQIVSFPDRASGSIRVDSYSETFGADVSLRQFLYGDLGATIDLLYGYQFMRLNGGLEIASNSTSLDDDFAPVGSTLFIEDNFGVTNEFHGGQFGLATNYREGCWSFNGLMKFGFGSLNRRATRRGVTITTVDDATAVDNNGLLVRSTNSGTVSDHTFAWVPELDLSLGWQRFAGWDFTFGYHVIALTDALQPSGAIDPDLAVNLSDPPIDAQRPSDGLSYRTFYVHGIHFGLQHVY